MYNYFCMLLVLFLYCGMTCNSYCGTSIENIQLKAHIGDTFFRSGKGTAKKSQEVYETVNGETVVKHNIFRTMENGRIEVMLVSFQSDIHFAFDGQKAKSSVVAEPAFSNIDEFHLKFDAAWDSEKTEFLKMTKHPLTNGEYIADAAIHGEKKYVEDPRTYGFYIKDIPVTSFLSGNWADGQISDLTREEDKIIDGILCVGFTGKIDNTNEMIHAWLSPELFYRPIYYEIKTDDSITEVRNTFYRNDEVFPKTIEVKTFHMNVDNTIELSSKAFMEITDYQTNVIIEEDIFSNIIPADVDVSDFRQKTATQEKSNVKFNVMKEDLLEK